MTDPPDESPRSEANRIRHARLKELFIQACDLPDDELQAYISCIRAENPRLGQSLDALIRADREKTEEVPRNAPENAVPEIENYRIQNKIAEGGMGEVWLAEQTIPVRRRVAIKLIKPGLDSREVLTRFESERQALALMQHSGIATVFDAGVSAEGRPFFAMEMVSGDTITAYCDHHECSLHQRLEIFLDVCEAVQHAHHKGIIHRDLKPSNILIDTSGEEPIPKIIDFGIAKAVSQRLTNSTLHTRIGQWMGTPEYMSPEQTGVADPDIDTRSDVYSLGVVLYELLAGAPPFTTADQTGLDFETFRRRIRDTDPPRPSTLVSRRGSASDEAARLRRTDTPGLIRILRGDLDWIVLRAMEKDRSRRYGSPSELAADIRRHLAHEAVLASPPGTRYRITKFVRRNRLAVLASAAVFIVLLAGITGTSFGLIKARQQAQDAKAVANFLIQTFRQIDPGGPMGQVDSPTAILDRSRSQLDQALADQPLVRAQLLLSIGSAYQNLGHYDAARPALEESFEIRRSLLGDMAPDLAANCDVLGWLAYFQADFEQARRWFTRELEIRRQAFGDDDPRLAIPMGALGRTEWRTGNLLRSRQVLERALEIVDAGGTSEMPIATTVLYPLGTLLTEFGETETAVRYLEQAVALQEQQVGGNHTTVGWMLLDLGIAEMDNRHRERARELFMRSQAIQEAALGTRHVAVSFPINRLAILDRLKGDYAAARDGHRKALELREEEYGPNHPDLVWILTPYAQVMAHFGDFETSFALLERARRLVEESFGPTHISMARTLERRGFVHYLAKDYDRAAADYCESLAIRKRIFGDHHPAHGIPLYNLACISALKGDHADAIARLEQVLAEGWTTSFLFDDPDFDSLRGLPEFQSISNEMRCRLDQTAPH